jgi:hypothetical protein
MDKNIQNVISIKPGTPEMEAFLQAGYPFSIEEAERIVKERSTSPATIPYERYTAAQAMLAAYKAKPQVISKRQPWVRQN